MKHQGARSVETQGEMKKRNMKIRILYSQGISQKALAERFGISVTRVYEILGEKGER